MYLGVCPSSKLSSECVCGCVGVLVSPSDEPHGHSQRWWSSDESVFDVVQESLDQTASVDEFGGGDNDLVRAWPIYPQRGERSGGGGESEKGGARQQRNNMEAYDIINGYPHT